MPVSRAKLYEAVWSKPMGKVAAQYGVSGSYLARVCELLGVPRPPRGYWARVKAGQKVRVPALPEPDPGQDLQWARGREPRTPPKDLLRAPMKPGRTRQYREGERPEVHPLCVVDPETFRKVYPSYRLGYLRPTKKRLVDVLSTKDALQNALKTASDLFLALEDLGYPVMMAPDKLPLHARGWDRSTLPPKSWEENPPRDEWTPSRPTVVFIGAVAIGLTVYEVPEYVEVESTRGGDRRVDRTQGRRITGWTSWRDLPCGKFGLKAYSPYSDTKWEACWRETQGKGTLSDRFPEILRGLKKGAKLVAVEVKEAAARAEVRHQQWLVERAEWERRDAERRLREAEERIREAEARRKESRVKSKTQLVRIMEEWALANRIERFFEQLLKEAENLTKDQRAGVLTRLGEARSLLGGTAAVPHFEAWRTPDEVFDLECAEQARLTGLLGIKRTSTR